MSTDDEERMIHQAVREELAKQRVISERRKTLWGDAPGQNAMANLCTLFPSLRGVPGTDPWDSMLLLRWLLTSEAVTTGSIHAAKFVLQVWNSRADYQQGARDDVQDGGLGLHDAVFTPFNVVEALAAWDGLHTKAFLTWAETPFWP